MKMTFDNLIASVGERRKVKGSTWDVVTVRLFDADEMPLDLFDIYLHSDGTWYAWTSDTVSQTKIQRRQKVAEQYNLHIALNKK